MMADVPKKRPFPCSDVAGQEEDGRTIPFLRRLIEMIQEQESIISFQPGDGKPGQNRVGKIIVHDRKRMEKEVLPRYFNHSSFASLRRQLNYFAFVRVGKGRSKGATYVNEDVMVLDDVLKLKRRHVGTTPTSAEVILSSSGEEGGEASSVGSDDKTVEEQQGRREGPSILEDKGVLQASNKRRKRKLRETPRNRSPLVPVAPKPAELLPSEELCLVSTGATHLPSVAPRADGTSNARALLTTTVANQFGQGVVPPSPPQPPAASIAHPPAPLACTTNLLVSSPCNIPAAGALPTPQKVLNHNNWGQATSTFLPSHKIEETACPQDRILSTLEALRSLQDDDLVVCAALINMGTNRPSPVAAAATTTSQADAPAQKPTVQPVA